MSEPQHNRDDSLSPAEWKQIEQVCDRLEQAWSNDSPPRLEEFLEPDWPKPQQAALLRDLLIVELDRRRALGQQPTVEEYRERFPDDESAVQQAFPASTEDETLATTPASLAPVRTSARQIGPYKLLQQIGEEGMGTVWMAEQEQPVRRRVALKLIRFGDADKQVIARFEAERQALAMMDHQHIARVLDAGTTEDGTPYFVMELVKGVPLTQYCDRNRLTIRDRLELFADVCRAVQHAHQKGIIHRDLKPSNVLVTQYDGKAVPKVIDFGLAKALEHTTKLTDKTMFTQFGQIVGTLQYMSPEQAEMNTLDVDTRTDIYSLGVMLYELLTGTTPIEKQTLQEHAILRVLEVIRENDPPRPSNRLSSASDEATTGISQQRQIAPAKLRQILRGELDWVVMKALEKDRNRRYETADGLAEDIRRYLDDEAVEACPPSTAYRIGKFVRRNRGLVATGAAIAVFLLVGIVGTWISAASLRARLWDSLVSQARAERSAGERARSVELITEAAEIKKNLDLRKEAIETIVSPGTSLVREFYAGVSMPGNVGFSPDGQKLAAVDDAWDDCNLMVWSFPSGNLLQRKQLEGKKGYDWSDGEALSKAIREFTGKNLAADSKILSGRKAICTNQHVGVSRDESGMLEVWHLKSERKLSAIEGIDAESDVRVTSDGRLIAVHSPNEPREIRILDAQSGKEQTILRTNGDAVTTLRSFAFSADNTLLAAHGTSGAKGVIRIWDMETGLNFATIQGHFDTCWSREGHFLVTIGPPAKYQELEPELLAKSTVDTDTPIGATNQGTYSGPPIQYATGYVKIWKATPPTPRYEFPRQIDFVRFRPDGKALAVDGSICEFADYVEGYRSLESVTETPGRWVAFDESGRSYGVNATTEWVAEGQPLTLWHVADRQNREVVLRPSQMKNDDMYPNDVIVPVLESIAFSADGSRMACASRIWKLTSPQSGGTEPNSWLEIWDLPNAKREAIWRLKEKKFVGLAFSPNDNEIVARVVTSSGLVRPPQDLIYVRSASAPFEWKLASENREALFNGSVRTFAFGPKGDLICGVVAGSEFTAPGGIKGTSSGPFSTREEETFEPITVMVYDVIEVVDFRTGDRINRLVGHEGDVLCLAMDPQGQILASAGKDRTIRIWNVISSNELARWEAHDDHVTAITFSPDGNTIASGCRDGTLKLWHLPTIREELAELGLNWEDP